MHPPPAADDLFVAEYVEPLAGNEVLLGFDVGSTSDRRSAIEEARDTGTVVATSPLDLVQGGHGFLLSLAVYDVREPPQTAPARRRHFIGVVVAAFDAIEMIRSSTSSEVEVEIYDVGLTVGSPTPLAAERLVFDQTPGTSSRDLAPRDLRTTVDLNVGSRRWRIIATPGPGFRSRAERFLPAVVAVASLLLTATFGLLVHTLLRSTRRAEMIAERMTVDLRQREADLAVANEDLEHANRELRDFLAISSHDMRAPLSSILGSVEMLAVRGEEMGEDGRRRLLDIAGSATARLVRLVDDLLTTSQIRAGALAVRPASLDLRAEVERALGMVSVDAGSIRVEGPPVRASADAAHVQRIATNLVENAFKYGAPPVVVEVRATDGMAELSVRDGGPGVPEDFRPRLFDRFARAPEAARSGKTGTGLGLSIVRGLAEANGGTASYVAGPDGGACFVVRLPSAE